MKRLLTASAALISFLAINAAAEEITLKPTKDLRVMCHPDEQGFNGGASTRLRATAVERTAAEFPVLAFDQAEMKAFLDKNKDKKVAAKLVVTIREVQGVTDAPAKLAVAAFDSASDWTEGAGAQVAAKPGEASALAAKTGEKKWTKPDGTEVADFKALVAPGGQLAATVNGKDADVAKDAANKEVTITLDEAFVKHLATDPNARGVFLFVRENGPRIDVYSREQAQHPPRLVLAAE